MSRRQQIEDKHSELEQQTYNLFPERWGVLYRESMFPGLTANAGDQGLAFGPGEREIPVTDANDLDAWYDNIDTRRKITGEQAARYQDGLPPAVFGYAEGKGRRV